MKIRFLAFSVILNIAGMLLAGSALQVDICPPPLRVRRAADTKKPVPLAVIHKELKRPREKKAAPVKRMSPSPAKRIPLAWKPRVVRASAKRACDRPPPLPCTNQWTSFEKPAAQTQQAHSQGSTPPASIENQQKSRPELSTAHTSKNTAPPPHGKEHCQPAHAVPGIVIPTGGDTPQCAGSGSSKAAGTAEGENAHGRGISSHHTWGGVPGGSPSGGVATPGAGGNGLSSHEHPSGMAPSTPHETGSVTPPVPLYTPQPSFPESAIEDESQGIVHIKALISEDGSVLEVVLLDSSGSSLLDREARETAGTWKFKPAMRGTCPVRSWARFTVNFKLE